MLYSLTKTKIQDLGDLLGEPVLSVRACGEGIEVTELYISWYLVV